MSEQVDAWLARVNQYVSNLADERVLYFATTGTQAEVAARVFDEGKTTDGQPVGYLEDYEVWAYKPPSPRRVSGKGKPNKDGKSRKIKGGYYATYLTYKAAMGRRETVFDLTSNFRKAYVGGAALKESNRGLTVDIVLSGKEALKWEGLTDQKGEFFKLSTDERESHVRRLLDLWRNILGR